MHILDHVCHEHGIEHHLTRANQPWTNGQVERVNRTVKEATVKQYHDQTAQQLQSHIHDFLAVYSFAKRLKALTGKTLMNISAMSRGKHQLS